LVVFSIAFAIIITGKVFYFCDNSLFLNTTDAVPIYTKVLYSIECIKNMQWPSWFPTWYLGTSVSQYYPPLTYIILIPLHLFLENTTLCLKVYIFSGLFIGGLGIWCIFYRYIGRFLGILAAIIYVTLPFFLIAFLSYGTVAQVPIVAITPWYLISCFEFFKEPKAKNWLIIIILTFILLLGHVMHGFMIALSTFIPMLLVSIMYRKGIVKIIIWGIGTVISAGILGFWWVTGVLPLENPGVPSLDVSAAHGVTANFLWFFPRFTQKIIEHFPQMENGIHNYFPFIIILIALISYFFIRKEKDKKYTILLFLYIQTVFTFIFSFGYHLPFFEYIPIAKNLVPGRILTLTAIGAVILTAYVVLKIILFIIRKIQFKKPQRKLYYRCPAIFVLILLLFFIKQGNTYYPLPFLDSNVVTDYSIPISFYSQLDNQNSAFDKGRLTWYGDCFDSNFTYFAYLYKYNILSGWNIEGTPNSKYIYFQNIALKYEKYDFIFKNMNDMNVQTYFVNPYNFPKLYELLKNNGFKEIGFSRNTAIMKRDNNSYFMEQPRNCIVIGKSHYIFSSDYPWFVNGYSDNPIDYDMDYLNNFDVIYYCEPELKDVSQIKTFEQQITQLANKGKAVFVEFGKAPLPESVLGVTPVNCTIVDDEQTNYKFLIKSNDNFNNLNFYIGLDAKTITGVYGLDNVLYGIKQDNSKFSVDIVGTKDVANGKVYFIGGPITQLKGFALTYLTGIKDDSSLMKQREKILDSIMTNLFSNYDMYTKLDLPAFDAQNINWGANSCEFNYQSDTSKRIMVSITYTPRWKVFIDGEEQKVDRVDNMLVFNVPAGSHQVVMKYTMTIYGKIGIGITILSLALMIFILLFYEKIMDILRVKVMAVIEYLQLPRLSNKGSYQEDVNDN